MAADLLSPPDALDDRDEQTRAHPVPKHDAEPDSTTKPELSPGELAAQDQREAAERDSKGDASGGGQPTASAKSTGGGFMGKASTFAKKRKGLLLAGGGFIAIFIVILAFILFLLGFKLNHLKNLFIDYQFAGFHRSMSQRLDHIITEDAILTEDSGKLAKAENTTLYEKLRGWDPNAALQELGDRGLKLEFEEKSLNRQGKLRAFEDPSGEKFYREGAQGIPKDAKPLSTEEFLGKFKTTMNETLYDKSNFFRRKTVNDVYERSGIKLARFREWLDGKFKNTDPTPQEAKEAVAQEELKTAETLKSGAITDEEVKADTEAAVKGEPVIEVGKVPTPLREFQQKISDVSQFAFIATIYCIMVDVFGQIDKALNTRIENFMRLAADTYTKADQQKAGFAPASAINASVTQFDGAEQSAAYQRAAGEPVTGPDLSKSDMPTTVMGFLPDQIKTISNVMDGVSAGPLAPFCVTPLRNVPGIKSGCSLMKDALTDYVCPVILNPVGQIGLASLETVVTIASVGLEKGATQAIMETLKIGAQAAAGIGISEYLFGHVIPSFIKEVSGTAGAGLTNPIDRTNRLDVGTNLIKNETAVTSGAHPISNTDAVAQIQIALNHQAAQDQARGPLYALFNLDNQRSFGARFLAQIPTSPSTLVASLHYAVSTIASPFRTLASLSASASAANVSADSFYGVKQYGWSDAEISGEATGFDFISNTDYVENVAKVDTLKKKYAKCLSQKLGDRLVHPDFDCDYNNADFKHYGMYVLDCVSVEQLATANTGDDTYKQSSCSDLTGTSNNTSTTPTTGTPSGGILPTGEYFKDSSATACPSGTTNATADGLVDGVYTVIPDQNIKIRICNVGSINVNVLIAGQINNLLTDSGKAGLAFSGGGWRNNAEQIGYRKKYCGTTDYDIYLKPPADCRDTSGNSHPVALPTPGGSRHEWGLAIDFRAGGVTIGSGSVAFNWLSANAATYGLSNLPSESWHWSVDGH